MKVEVLPARADIPLLEGKPRHGYEVRYKTVSGEWSHLYGNEHGAKGHAKIMRDIHATDIRIDRVPLTVGEARHFDQFPDASMTPTERADWTSRFSCKGGR